jgi:DNA-binding response OmpR family regulator
VDIIYVEDDDQEAFIMRIGMRRQGINVIHVPEITVETIADLQSPPYAEASAVIFDAILARESGVNLARRLRAHGDQRPILLLTAGENPDPSLLKSLDIQYIRKPANFEQLARLLRDAQAK